MHEMLALIDPKREKHFAELDIVDAHDLMDPYITKWIRVLETVMAEEYFPCLHDYVMCKSKWHLFIPNYRMITDYHARTCMNTKLYWTQSSREHVQEGLVLSPFVILILVYISMFRLQGESNEVAMASRHCYYY